MDAEFEEEEEKRETGKLTAETRTQEEAKLEEEAAAREAAGADWRETFLRADTRDPKNISSTKDATEVQEAVRPHSGHALGRAWPLQSVVKQDYVQPEQWIPNAQVLITCVHGERNTYPVATVLINWRGQEECLSVEVIPDLGEDIIIGTDYVAFAYLLNNANQERIANLWWKEAPFVTSEIEEHSIRRKLSKKQKREQKQGYRRRDENTQLSVPTDPNPIMTVAGSL
ncbi:hypothetical protein NDU88_003190 [Pleurodeles waltl]|uniref:Uncharacterized protein n=1 Tax=Pleurodeles waltl TaxID=8319 RepID=A0AAV7SG66_PLEWA|nr:hypothetical protein NDU88_003190 [Pleurodeles waltl]